MEEKRMGKKIIAVNAGPRMGWNTETLTYSMNPMCCNENMISVLLIMTSNAPDYSYRDLLGNYQQTLNRFVGPATVFVSGDTLQIRDYGKTDWPWYFDGEAKHKRHETVFPEECRKVYELGIGLAK